MKWFKSNKRGFRFISALSKKLHQAYPLNVPSNTTAAPPPHIEGDLVHIHFKDLNYIVEYTPLLVTYAVLFLYIYFSVRESLTILYRPKRFLSSMVL